MILAISDNRDRTPPVSVDVKSGAIVDHIRLTIAPGGGGPPLRDGGRDKKIRTITGVVLRGDGTAEAGALVMPYRTFADERNLTHAGSDGRFSRSTRARAWTVVDVHGGSTATVALRGATAARIVGRFIDARGRGMPGFCTVRPPALTMFDTLWQGPATAVFPANSGTFEIVAVPAGKVILSCNGPTGGAIKILALEPGAVVQVEMTVEDAVDFN